MAVVNNLKEIREERGLLQEDLASATGFCTKTIGRVDKRMLSHLRTIQRIADKDFLEKQPKNLNLTYEKILEKLCVKELSAIPNIQSRKEQIEPIIRDMLEY